MDSVQLALLALLAGAIIGGGLALLLLAAFRVRDRARTQESLAVPDGVGAVLEALDEPAAVVDNSFTVVSASRPGAGLGMLPGEVLDGAELRALVRSARTTSSAAVSTLRIKRPGFGGEERLVSARAVVLGPRLSLLVARDITEQERIEQMRRDFVANTSHELKTPVGAVSLLSEAIESASDDPEQVRVFATRLQAEAARLAQLTARIMNLSRLQAADELTVMADVSVDEVIAISVDAHAMQAQSAGVELMRGGERGLYVRGDIQILIEAVGNIIANAITYSPRGSRVAIAAHGDTEIVEISVTDQGIGIAEAEQQRVFERFYRADQARSRGTGGSGLGLSIVKHAVQRHGGEVMLWSRPGRGSTFTIRLPRIAGPTPDVGGKRRKRAKVPKPAKPFKPDKAMKADKAAKPSPPDRSTVGQTLAPEKAPPAVRTPKAGKSEKPATTPKAVQAEKPPKAEGTPKVESAKAEGAPKAEQAAKAVPAEKAARPVSTPKAEAQKAEQPSPPAPPDDLVDSPDAPAADIPTTPVGAAPATPTSNGDTA